MKRVQLAQGKPFRIAVPAVMLAAVLSACGSAEPKTDKAATAVDLTKPAVMSVYASSTSFTEDVFQTRIADPIRKKFPNYTLNYIKPGSMKMADMLTTNNVPDIFLFALPEMQSNLLQYNLQYDMTELIKSNGVNLSRFSPGLLQTFRDASGGGKLYGLPESFNPHVMLYNKDVYDKFGVPYPKDGMTWDDAYQTSRKLTNQSDGIQYRGLTFFFRTVLANNSDSLPLIDPKTEKAAVNSASWKKHVDNIKRFYELNGMLTGYKSGSDGNTELVSFYTDKNAAAVISPFSGYTRDGMKDIKWDMVSVPVFAEQKGVGLQVEPRALFISSTSQVKEQAFQVIMHLLSDEVETANSKLGKTTSLTNEAIPKTFASDIEALKGKNTMAVFYNKPAPSPSVPNLSTNAGSLLSKEMDQVIQGKKDVNTALRNAEETINKAIDEEIAKRKP